MNSFFEEYGRITLVVVVIAGIIGVAWFFRYTGFDFAKSNMGAYAHRNYAVNELQDAREYSIVMPSNNNVSETP